MAEFDHTLTTIEDELDTLETMKTANPEEFKKDLDDLCGDAHELARAYMDYFNPDLKCSLDEYLFAVSFSIDPFMTKDALALGHTILKLWN